ncbi:MAG TPA: DUF4304 domain-containing protein [Planctomycetota bacterium]|jgi:hypothetical protein|nr:DUF4304 domain-containing protein [Planctomycetota bacterium]
MTNSEFKGIIRRAFTLNGFRYVSKNLRFDGSAASILIGLQKFEYGESYFINVGLYLRTLGDEVPAKVEHTHMYFRLERLFPEWSDAIIIGGQLSHHEQPDLAVHLARLIEDKCVPALVELANSLDRIRRVWKDGGLRSGFILKEARQLLSSEISSTTDSLPETL